MGFFSLSHNRLRRLSFLLFSTFILYFLKGRIVRAIFRIFKVFSFRGLFLINTVIHLKNWFNIFQSFQLIASFLLVLRHVPFWYVLLAAVFTMKRPQPHMLSYMHFQIWSSIIFLCAPLELTMIFINILMSFFMIT